MPTFVLSGCQAFMGCLALKPVGIFVAYALISIVYFGDLPYSLDLSQLKTVCLAGLVEFYSVRADAGRLKD
ncbi:hypothetical protein [Methylomonas lenta]|uniref:hypothetical protein n=1 Tax=Methylomonas lenta TaxID=980561 RepID=UPI000A8B8422|nr:hypothetical protein [Methylomonas lenta]